MNKYLDIVNQIDKRLIELSDFTATSYSELLEAQKYSLTAGGKHLRGLILVKCAALGNKTADEVLDFACALEMVHTYSLIHDDLPEMDNDDLRRGKPTCHVRYGCDIALLAGDAMLTKAFNVIARDCNFSDSVKIECVRVLSDKCGEHGMLAGQTIDKQSEGKIISSELLDELHSRKTGDMFSAAVIIGCLLGNVDLDIRNKLLTYIEHLGISFQIKDDILDVVSSSDVLGKPTSSDDKSLKSTYVSVYGLEESEAILQKHTLAALDIAKDFDDQFFSDIAHYFAKRIN